MIRKLFTYLLYAVVILLVVLFLSPYNTAFVQSNSMAPVIQSGDLFLVEPSSDVEVGDIIVYRSADGDELVTHRVVDIEPEGFITKGDNNPSTDQAAGEPPVQKSQVVGEVVEIQNVPITVPQIGVLSQLFSLYRSQILAGLFIIILLDTLRRDYRSSSKKRTREFDITPFYAALYISVVLVLVWSAFIFMTANTIDSRTFEATTGPTDEPRELQVGSVETFETNITVSKPFFPLSVHVNTVGSSQVVSDDVVQQNQSSEIRKIRYQVGPFEDEGVRSVRFKVYSYPHLLPTETITWLHNIHPIIAALGTVGLIPIPIIILTLIFADSSPIRSRGSGGRGGLLR